MCIALPGKVIGIGDAMARVEVAGTRLEASLMLTEGVEIGDYVLIHAGFVIRKVDEEEARETLRLLSEFLEEQG
ncbi:MAG: HypC/HybG/HupF family hydrogenase formation chaperone [Thermodesulfovibrionales bacterium]